MMQPLLRRLVFDVPHLTDHSKMPLKVNTQPAVRYNICIQELINDIMALFNTSICQLLTGHYEQRWKYYSLTGGLADQGLASEEELLLSRKLFWGVFKALAKQVNHFEYLCQFQDLTKSANKK